MKRALDRLGFWLSVRWKGHCALITVLLSPSGWGWQGPLEPAWSKLRQSHPEQGAQAHTQVAFEDLQERKLHSLSGQCVPLLAPSASQ